jgi:hypothetical protein
MRLKNEQKQSWIAVVQTLMEIITIYIEYSRIIFHATHKTSKVSAAAI